MSARNTLENKALRRDLRQGRKVANQLDGKAQSIARYGRCPITQRYTILDIEHGYSAEGWRQIGVWETLVKYEDYINSVLDEMEADSEEDDDSAESNGAV